MAYVSFLASFLVSALPSPPPRVVPQGSACIYSKKVEYLYTLIYQTLDLLMQQKRKRQASSIRADGVDTDAMVEAEEELLLLNDVIPIGKSIDLDEKPETYDAIAAVAAGGRLPLGTPRAAAAATHTNLMAMTPLSRLRAFRSDGGGADSFQLAACPVDPHSGALMMDLSQHGLLAAPQDAGPRAPGTPASRLLLGLTHFSMDASGFLDSASTTQNAAAAAARGAPTSSMLTGTSTSAVAAAALNAAGEGVAGNSSGAASAADGAGVPRANVTFADGVRGAVDDGDDDDDDFDDGGFGGGGYDGGFHEGESGFLPQSDVRGAAASDSASLADTSTAPVARRAKTKTVAVDPWASLDPLAPAGA